MATRLFNIKTSSFLVKLLLFSNKEQTQNNPKRRPSEPPATKPHRGTQGNQANQKRSHKAHRTRGSKTRDHTFESAEAPGGASRPRGRRGKRSSDAVEEER